MVVAVSAVFVVEIEVLVGWFLSWVRGPLVQLLGSGGLMEVLCLGDGLLCLGCLLDLVFLWGERSVSGMGIVWMWLVLYGLNDFADWRYNLE